MNPFALVRNEISAMRARLLRLRGASLVGPVQIEPMVSFQYPKHIVIGENTRIARNVVLRANTANRPGVRLGASVEILENCLLSANEGHIAIGDRTRIAPGCLVYGNGGVDIGADVLVAAHTSINTVSHNAARTDVSINSQGVNCAPVVIEDDVWLGLNVTILQGVRIGKGAIVGAGSLVSKDIPAWSIAVGTPARVLRQRNDEVREAPADVPAVA
ncbi:MAG: acyltransferase [Pseudomonadota bacterium]